MTTELGALPREERMPVRMHAAMHACKEREGGAEGQRVRAKDRCWCSSWAFVNIPVVFFVLLVCGERAKKARDQHHTLDD